jgi:hypothetical protein
MKSLPSFKQSAPKPLVKALLTAEGLWLLAGLVLLITAALWWMMYSRQIPAGSTHKNIVTTVFWVGEASDVSNGFIPNAQSAWDGSWLQNYGGIDAPAERHGYNPAGFTPHENPFYAALPYNDLDASGSRKATAVKCKAFSPSPDSQHSWCKNTWIAINHEGRTAYAQWEDVGPFEEDDAAYVFGSKSPRNQNGVHAGLDDSPAVRDYLRLADVERTDWRFISARDVPYGPWKTTVTTSAGYRVQ